MKEIIDDGLDIFIQERHDSLVPKRHLLKMENYFLIHKWTREDSCFSFYNKIELRTLHRKFRQPFMRALHMLLRRANRPSFDLKITESLEKIKEHRKICNKLASSPRRFRLSVGSEELRFNHRVQLYTKFTEGRPVIDMVDKATHFCASSFLLNQPTKKVWETILNMWSLVYLSPLAIWLSTNDRSTLHLKSEKS